MNNRTDSAATACGWIDFNENGQFDNAEYDDSTTTINAERLCVSNIPSSTAPQTIELNFTIPDDVVGNGGDDNQYFSRFRLSTDSAFLTEPSPLGEAGDGEVEDHAIPYADEVLFRDRFEG